MNGKRRMLHFNYSKLNRTLHKQTPESSNYDMPGIIHMVPSTSIGCDAK
jgi:hypothetical protein